MTAEDKRSVVTALLTLIVMESLYRKGGPSYAAVMDGGTSFRSPKQPSPSTSAGHAPAVTVSDSEGWKMCRIRKEGRPWRAPRPDGRGPPYLPPRARRVTLTFQPGDQSMNPISGLLWTLGALTGVYVVGWSRAERG